MTALKNSSNSPQNFDAYIPQHDLAEVERLQALYGSAGVDMDVSDDLNEFMQDMGLNPSSPEEK